MVAPVTPGRTYLVRHSSLFQPNPEYPPEFFPVFEKGVDLTSRQRKPYLIWLPFQSHTWAVVDWSSYQKYGYTGFPQLGNAVRPQTAFIQATKEKAFLKLKDKLGDSSMWAVNIREYQQSLDLITTDAFRLLRGVRQIARFDFAGAARTYRMLVPKGLKAKAKALGDNWLKFHFGVEPLIQDIGNAVETLQNPFPRQIIKTSSRGPLTRTVLRNDRFPYSGETTYQDVSVKAKCQVEVQLSNPNLYLANQLGFVNPASFVWETIPFSFLVDWFGNIGAFLDQFTMFAGIEILQSTTTYSQTALWHDSLYAYEVLGDLLKLQSYGVESYYFERALGLPSVELRVYPWKSPSPVRAATAISLLLQGLKS